MIRRTNALALLVAAPAVLLAGCASGGAGGGETPAPDDYIGATFSSTDNGEPRLEFADDGTYSGSDGCNGLRGDYTVDGDTIVLEPGISTLKDCKDVDDWLRNATSVQIDGDTLTAFAEDGSEIGTLSRG
ncbi:META domain-containing protein [Alcanivoracaceae bacterium MT1]